MKYTQQMIYSSGKFEIKLIVIDIILHRDSKDAASFMKQSLWLSSMALYSLQENPMVIISVTSRTVQASLGTEQMTTQGPFK